MRTGEDRKIITRAFIATGHDGERSLIEYIDKLERALLRMDRDMRDRRQSVHRARVIDVVREYVR